MSFFIRYKTRELCDRAVRAPGFSPDRVLLETEACRQLLSDWVQRCSETTTPAAADALARASITPELLEQAWQRLCSALARDGDAGQDASSDEPEPMPLVKLAGQLGRPSLVSLVSEIDAA